LPTYSFKRIRVPHRMVTVAMAGIAVVAAAMITEPRITLAGLIIVYASSIPFSIHSFRQRQRQEKAMRTSEDAEEPPSGDGPESVVR